MIFNMIHYFEENKKIGYYAVISDKNYSGRFLSPLYAKYAVNCFFVCLFWILIEFYHWYLLNNHQQDFEGMLMTLLNFFLILTNYIIFYSSLIWYTFMCSCGKIEYIFDSQSIFNVITRQRKVRTNLDYVGSWAMCDNLSKNQETW